MSGWKNWQIGEVVRASELQSYVQDQVVQVYASSAARGSALGTFVSEGMVSYLSDTDSTEVYNGSSWIAVGAGDITSVTAGTALTGGGVSGAVTLNVNQAALYTNGTAGHTLLSNGTAGLTYQPVSPNYIINGAFDFWQRGTSFGTAFTGQFTADRWKWDGAATAVSSTERYNIASDLPTAGATGYAVKFTNSSTADFQFLQQVEDVTTLNGQIATFSFWAKSDAAGSIPEAYAIQDFGSGGSPGVVTNIPATGTTSSTWKRFTGTFTLPSTSGKTIGAGNKLIIRIDPGNTITGTYYLWGFQLEAGSVATPFKRAANTLQGELAACQRYFERVEGNGSFFGPGFVNSATLVYGVYTYKIEKRVVPTYSSSSATALQAFSATTGTVATTANSAAVLASTKVGVIQATVSGFTGGQGGMLGLATGGFIDFSSEL